ncbi:hypothetical protein C8A00DRAFT_37518 [Chaetomidium leptoderma]|uniref:Transcription factor Iwr1 domain-containing protein n=1 Tax=Chaetomidium leptoderma TaxID=669021 RepID=A0AAN6VFI7_9PEZI|nr:hypothetical protein C8A00DRAFT_37518 [Chaetomidium leptoderma]
MAGLPPDTIHVKRKRGTDEGPVDFLRLERSKRYRSGDGGWIYQRKPVEAERASPAVEPSTPATPIIQPTREGDESRLLRHSQKTTQAPAKNYTTAPGPAPEVPPAPEQPAPAVLSHPTTDRLRRFHLSRSNSPQLATGVPKKRIAPAVFIERGAKKQRETLNAIAQEHNVTQTGPPQPLSGSQSLQSSSPTEEEPATAQQPSPIKYKRPGARTCTTAPTSKPTLPPSMRSRENTNMDELARVMDSWTLDEITKGLEKMEKQETTSKYSPAKSRFKPKAPTQRYFERHPESLAGKERETAGQRAAIGPAVMDVDMGVGDSTDEEDYVLETYERVPAELLRDRTVSAHRVGLLVFDTDPDMAEFFYGNESDSEDDFPEDEDDENAENYYAADYPDEDLDWDDEFDRNAYHYTNQNAADMEEFDERGFIDDVWEKSDQVGSLPG